MTDAGPPTDTPPTTPQPQPQPQWLTDTERDAWMNLAQLLMLLPTALDQQLREDAGLPHAYYQILVALSSQPERAIRMSQLARLSGTTATRLSHAVTSLEQRGWVTRQPCPDDKRGQIAHLTDAGMAVLRAAAPGHVAEVRRLVFDHLTGDDVTRLRDITARLLPNLAKS